jgi:hypothetical protein
MCEKELIQKRALASLTTRTVPPGNINIPTFLAQALGVVFHEPNEIVNPILLVLPPIRGSFTLTHGASLLKHFPRGRSSFLALISAISPFKKNSNNTFTIDNQPSTIETRVWFSENGLIAYYYPKNQEPLVQIWKPYLFPNGTFESLESTSEQFVQLSPYFRNGVVPDDVFIGIHDRESYSGG